MSEAFLVFTFQKIMKRLIKRYVLKAQVDRENDEVNEGKGLDHLPVARWSRTWSHQAKIRVLLAGLCSCLEALGRLGLLAHLGADRR